MSTALRLQFSYEQYLRALEDSELKLEYWDGVIYAMAGGTPTHARLAARVIATLERLVGQRCAVYSSDLKVRAEAPNVSSFPDATVVCGPTQAAPIDANSVVNPTVLVEVTSKSTEEYDRGDKLTAYQQIPSLRAVLFVSHRAPRVTLVKRTEGSSWSELEFRAGDTVVLLEPELQLPVDELFAGITLEGG